ncbi:MAG: hypothetical protein HYY87_00230 [Candidatus Levybacteria bacterium]|nr:hypothetical protein [Candidatus Levybacteria bacterium]MBI3069717.1 hypothetical protein [Candidatus Levybacteria bacterium]
MLAKVNSSAVVGLDAVRSCFLQKLMLDYFSMAKTGIVNTTVAKKLFSELELLEQLKTRILSILPEDVIPYGSKLWWEKAELEADKDIQTGRYTVYRNAATLIKDLHKGK